MAADYHFSDPAASERTSLLARRSLPTIGLAKMSITTTKLEEAPRTEPLLPSRLDSAISLSPLTPISAPPMTIKSVMDPLDSTASPAFPTPRGRPMPSKRSSTNTIASRRGMATPAQNLSAIELPSLHTMMDLCDKSDSSAASSSNLGRASSRSELYPNSADISRRSSDANAVDTSSLMNYTSSSTGAATTPSDDPSHGGQLDRKISLTTFSPTESTAVGTPGHTRQFSEADAYQQSFSFLVDKSRFSAATHDGLRTGTSLGHSQPPSRLAPSETPKKVDSQPNSSNVPGLMGTSAGHFGPSIRDKALVILERLIPTIPVHVDGGLISIIEYACCRSNSASMLPPIIKAFNEYCTTVNPTSDALPDFSILHADTVGSDFRQLQQSLDGTSTSYMNPSWQATQLPSLSDRVFSAFTARRFQDSIAPAHSVSLGLSMMDMHWLHGTRNSRYAAHNNELQNFLSVRAKEFKRGGILLLAYLQTADEENALPSSGLASPPAFTSPLKTPGRPLHHPLAMSSSQSLRGRSESTPSRPPSFQIKRDIWSSLANTLAPCIQRLVSCGMVKSDVARHLLQLPLYPRSAAQTMVCLQSVSDLWKLEHSCGLVEYLTPVAETSKAMDNEPALKLQHPACRGLASGLLSQRVYAEHVLTFCRNVYEAHFRSALREHGNLGRGPTEWVLDALWEALREKVEDGALKELELDITVLALRRL